MASISHAGGKLSTNAVLKTVDGKDINLGQLDKKILGVSFTPRLWFYKYITYKVRVIKSRKRG